MYTSYAQTCANAAEYLATLRWPQSLARSRGECPLTSCTSILAPSSISSFRHCTWPSLAAWCTGVTKSSLVLQHRQSSIIYISKCFIRISRVATHTRYQNSLTFPWPFPDLSAFFPDQSNIQILRYLRIHMMICLNNRFVHALYMFQIANLCK